MVPNICFGEGGARLCGRDLQSVQNYLVFVDCPVTARSYLREINHQTPSPKQVIPNFLFTDYNVPLFYQSSEILNASYGKASNVLQTQPHRAETG